MIRSSAILGFLTVLSWLTGFNHSAAEFTPIVGWDHQLFPSYLIATAAVKPDETVKSDVLGDRHGQLGVQITATKDNQKVKVSIACDGYMEPSEWNGVLPSAGESYVINPKVRYRFEQLSKCIQATPATITFRVKLDDSPVEEIATTVTFRSVNDCPIKVAIGDEVIDTKFTVAAYVNEQHPFVDKLLREALDLGVVDKFDGYQSGQPEDVVRQVYALWDLLVARDVRYSSITATAGSSSMIASQHIRMLEETLNNSQANCVDGSVLLVSMLRKIGINAALVLQPGHCYIAFAADEKGEITFGLETTLIGAQVDDADDVPELLEDAVEEDVRDEHSWPSFVAAIALGHRELVKNEDKLKSTTDADYAFIDLSTWRAQGVLPIPFAGREQFVAYDHSARYETDEGEGETDEDEETDEETDEEEEEEEAR